MNEEQPSPLGRHWLDIAQELGLTVEAPFTVILPSGASVTVDARLHDFGGPSGMLLVAEYSRIREHTESLVNQGFGYSTLDSPTPGESYDREITLEMLQDWGWASESPPPPWL
jgi:hypothetical protein